MRHIRQALVPLLLLPLALTACGTESGDEGGADRAELQRRAKALEIQLDMVYVTEVKGFDVAEQSVNVYGDHGFQSAYVAAKGGGMIQLSVDEKRTGSDDCAIAGSTTNGEKVRCERDGQGEYRVSGTAHEYVRNEENRAIRLHADRASVDRDTLRAAAEAAHQADDAEIDSVLPQEPRGADGDGGAGGVERGDLPTTGDGAPNNDVGASG
ncbi:hypothetical protein LRS74_12690 [Streptomyces sp. LX-29]|uniref:hypothetical protein n=1 Tax=Streptomyces sp. LX-29 TaxID=2900152 RepID=UPI00240D0EE0|nr:hypothetical protein [Streptomyces sp. LX-29]WFB07805.1 hypothetical protein LRS74_12690 [Streptomyces sp. LX-29]